jgi:hypothetical protein
VPLSGDCQKEEENKTKFQRGHKEDGELLVQVPSFPVRPKETKQRVARFTVTLAASSWTCPLNDFLVSLFWFTFISHSTIYWTFSNAFAQYVEQTTLRNLH